MPFSFIDIEEQKSRLIWWLFLFLIGFYFLTAYLLLIVLENSLFAYFVSDVKRGFVYPSLAHALITFVLASILAAIHWTFSTSNIIDRLCVMIGANLADESDTYHKYFKNIVEEVSIAIGGRFLEARVISSASMNAFALEDFKGRAVIGTTEGLLTRLNRSQIEAVVAHEAGHIISGDCLSTTVTCSLFEIYEEALSKIGGAIRHTRGRGIVVLILVFVMIKFMHFFSTLIRYFISRQREYRADAISVRLTRNPLSLAEALRLISGGWRGAGLAGDKMQSIYIINPSYSALDEVEGAVSNSFSTHPPIKRRIDVLLDMAHLDQKSLDQKLKNFQRVSPVAESVVKYENEQQNKRSFILKENIWVGPFLPVELLKQAGFNPDSWVKDEVSGAVKHAYEDERILCLFNIEKEDGAETEAQRSVLKNNCPHCHVALTQVLYEGAPILRCSYCEGVFVEYEKVSRILIRQDKIFSSETTKMAETIFKDKEKFRNLRKIDPKTAWSVQCPLCVKHKMRRQFFVYSYPVEIDRCTFCGGIWFDRHELEILQYLYEHKEQFFDGKSF